MPRTRAGLLSAYQRHLSLQRDLSQHTVRAYLVDVGDLLSFLGVGEGDAEPVEPALATLDLADLRDWLAAQAADGRSRATLARRSASVRTFSTWAFEEGLLASDVAVRLRAPPRRQPTPRGPDDPAGRTAPQDRRGPCLRRERSGRTRPGHHRDALRDRCTGLRARRS